MNLLTLLHTVRHLRPVQVSNRAMRRIPPRPRAPRTVLRPRPGVWQQAVAYQPDPLQRPSRLRDYTLHYHQRPSVSEALLWVASHPPASAPGWEPYPLSRRIVNWIKWLDPLPVPLLASLAAQADYLSRSLEYHLLANHLFVNAKALVFAGAYLDGPHAMRWLSTGLSVIDAEIREQVLADGGHFERSPLYHSLVLEDLLDLVNLGRAYPGLLPDYSEPAARMLSWLRNMVHPDGEISFFNDAAFGVAPPLAGLDAYAARLGIDAPDLGLSDSGYVRLANRSTVALFDAAPIGPDYQPGHAHADTLSFELSHGGQRLLVNSGTSTYNSGPQRTAERGTAAHNTLRLDGADQSEVWAAFRVGRRARPLLVRTDHGEWAEAAHDGYKPVTHHRRLEFQDGDLVVTDALRGTGRHRAEIFFHLAPGVSPALVHLDPTLSPSLESTTYHPRFETSIPNQTVVGRWEGDLPAAFVTKICVVQASACAELQLRQQTK